MIAAAFLVGVAVGIAILAVCVAWDRQAQQPRRESMSERHDRLDREAAAEATARAERNIAAFERLGRSENR